MGIVVFVMLNCLNTWPVVILTQITRFWLDNIEWPYGPCTGEIIILDLSWSITELGGHGHELNGHWCPYPRHGHGRGMGRSFSKIVA